MVLTGVSQIVRASNLYCFIARLFSTCSRLIGEIRTEDPILVFPTQIDALVYHAALLGPLTSSFVLVSEQ